MSEFAKKWGLPNISINLNQVNLNKVDLFCVIIVNMKYRLLSLIAILGF